MIRQIRNLFVSQLIVKPQMSFFSFFKKKPVVEKQEPVIDEWDKENWKQMGNIINQICLQNQNKPKYLPLQEEGQKDKLTVVLELDECLIYSFSPDTRENWMTAPIRNWDFSVELPEFETWIDIYKREHLDQFLDYCLKHTEPVIWSCGHPSYVNLVMSQICPQFPKTHILTQEQCNLIEEPEQTLEVFFKDMNILGRDRKKLIYIDSKPLSFLGSGDNSLPLTVFTADNTDTHSKDDLLNLVKELELLSKESDVRQILKKRYKMEETQRECKLIL